MYSRYNRFNSINNLSIEEYLQAMMNAASIKLPDPNQDRFLREKEVLQMTALKKTTMKNRIKEGTFPKSFKLGLRYRMWSLNEVKQWMEQQKATQGVE